MNGIRRTLTPWIVVFGAGLGACADRAIDNVISAGNDVDDAAVATQEFSRTVPALRGLDRVQQFQGNCAVTAERPGGTKALRFEATEPKGHFSGRIDPAPLGIEPHDDDLLRIEVEPDNNAFLQLTMENYQEPGDVSNWHALDAISRGTGWKTVRPDIKQPEEIEPGKSVDIDGLPGMTATGPRLASLLHDWSEIGITQDEAVGVPGCDYSRAPH